MAKEAVLQVRIDGSLKERADALCRRRGTTLSEAVRLFVQESVDRGALPFPANTRPGAPEGELHAAGILAHGARPELRDQEAGAWRRAMEAKHGLRP